MGQYYIVVNITKREVINPHVLNEGVKLMEWAYTNNAVTNATINLLMGRWKGDKVIIAGDYATYGDGLEEEEDRYDAYTIQKLHEVGIDKLYKLATEEYRELNKNECDTKNPGIRYFYNNEAKEYFDLKDTPADKDGTQVSPPPS